ncbi:hypothetical protein LXM25_16425 [Dyadobacter sp. LJ53]|uniref:hypothetical protein n=1 Tax=Dyadobacter chenwenxiniae TaxID=2906456 RepID=UPI001F46685C|nr:hypothetical protein [Dyadobacter chenwenxiniae]MCF0051656.1 hypothetical protein [Dyadobacter chenwenxiniae]
MDIISETVKWLKTDLLQGKSMVVYGLAILVTCILGRKSENMLLKGMFFPSVLLAIMFISYGGNIVIRHTKKQKELFFAHQANKQIFYNDQKARQEDLIKSYNTTLAIWTVAISAGLLIFFITESDYFKGVALGILILGISAFVADSFFRQSAKSYYENTFR